MLHHHVSRQHSQPAVFCSVTPDTVTACCVLQCYTRHRNSLLCSAVLHHHVSRQYTQPAMFCSVTPCVQTIYTACYVLQCYTTMCENNIHSLLCSTVLHHHVSRQYTQPAMFCSVTPCVQTIYTACYVLQCYTTMCPDNMHSLLCSTVLHHDVSRQYTQPAMFYSVTPCVQTIYTACYVLQCYTMCPDNIHSLLCSTVLHHHVSRQHTQPAMFYSVTPRCVQTTYTDWYVRQHLNQRTHTSSQVFSCSIK